MTLQCQKYLNTGILWPNIKPRTPCECLETTGWDSVSLPQVIFKLCEYQGVQTLKQAWMTLVLSSGQPECFDLPEHTSQTVPVNTLRACFLMLGSAWLGMDTTQCSKIRLKVIVSWIELNLKYKWLYRFFLSSGYHAKTCVLASFVQLCLETQETHEYLMQHSQMSLPKCASTEKLVSKIH